MAGATRPRSPPPPSEVLDPPLRRSVPRVHWLREGARRTCTQCNRLATGNAIDSPADDPPFNEPNYIIFVVWLVRIALKRY